MMKDTTVILLQIVTGMEIMSPTPCREPLSPSSKTIIPKLKMLGPLCDQTDKRCPFVKHNED